MLTAVCPGCRKQLSFSDDQAGKRLRCPACTELVTPKPLPPETAVASSASPETAMPRAADSKPPVAAPVTVPPAAEAPPELAFLLPPTTAGDLGRLGVYRVVRLLGRGGMGSVFEAVDPNLNRRVALKVMAGEAATHPQGRTRFLREARAAAALQHDHVVSIYQVGEDNGVPFLVMPLLVGESLETRLARPERLPIPQVVRIGREVAEGLAAAHAAKLVHRDVKPANVWLEAPNGRVKLLDFGLAREESADERATRLTRTGAVMGTPGYMAPEQVGGQADHRTDLFALGCILYEMLTGKPPFVADSLLGLMACLARHDPPPPRAVNPQVPAELSALVAELLAKEPAERPAAAAPVAERLRRLEALPPPTPTPTPTPSPTSLRYVAVELEAPGPAVVPPPLPIDELPTPPAARRRDRLLVIGLVVLLGVVLLQGILIVILLLRPARSEGGEPPRPPRADSAAAGLERRLGVPPLPEKDRRRP